MTRLFRGPYEVLGTEDIYRNPWIHLHEDQVIRPGGSRGVFGVVEMKEGSSVLAMDEDGIVYLVREYKYAIERDSLELMSGALEDGESPLEAAKRELREELGLIADVWIPFGVVDPFTTVVRSPNHMFLARKLRPAESSPDEGEVLNVVKVPFATAEKLVLDGEITHSASCVLLLKVGLYLRSQESNSISL